MTTVPALNLSHRLFFFGLIGASAAAIHISIVFLLANYLNLHPLIANIFAFLTAFNVSFIGHKYLTFAKLQDQKSLSRPHFFIVSASGAILNESLYYLFLKFTSLNYLVSLVIVLGLVAIYTFTLSRHWACR